jgi:O-antigen/teichoic acid export membrane protein
LLYFAFQKVNPIKKLLGNISFILLLNLLVKPVGLIVENLVQDRIGHDDYGLFSALFSLSAIGAVLSDLGISQLATKKLASDPDYFSAYFPTVFPVKIFLALAFPVLMVGVGWILQYDLHTLYLLGFISFTFGVMQFILFFRATLQGNQNFNIDAVGSVADKFLLVFFVLALLPIGLTLENFVYARTVATGIAFLTLYALITKLYGRLRIKLNRLHLRELLRESYPFALITLVYGINERVDIVMLERLSTAKEAGLYAGPYRWVDAVMMYMWTVLPIFFAKFALNIQANKEQEKLLHFGQVVVSIPIIFISVFSLFYGRIFFFQFQNSSPEEVDMMVRNLQILFLNVLVHGFFAIYSTLLTSTNFEKPVSRLVIASIILNISLNVIFIPQYGSMAAACNTLFCAVFVSVGYFIMVGRMVKIKLPVGLIGKLMLLTGLLYGTFYGLQFLSGTWWLNAAAAGIVFLILVFLLRIISFADLRQLRKQES